MKQLIYVLALLSAACAPNNSTPSSSPVAELENEPLHISHQETQSYNLHDMNVSFTRVRVINVAFESKDIFLLRTPAEKIVFMIDNKTLSFHESLSARSVALVERAEEKNSQQIDLGIQHLINASAVENALNVERCRTVPLRQQVIEVLSRARNQIYFGVANGQETSLKLAIAWDLSTNRFTGFRFLDSIPDPGQIGGQSLLLTPIINPYGNDKGLFTDSALLDAGMFNFSCDQKYGRDRSRKSDEPRDPNLWFTPKFDPIRDPIISASVTPRMQSLRSAFGYTESAYSNQDDVPLTSELVSHAKSQPIYKQFHGEL